MVILKYMVIIMSSIRSSSNYSTDFHTKGYAIFIPLLFFNDLAHVLREDNKMGVRFHYNKCSVSCTSTTISRDGYISQKSRQGS